MNCVKNFYNNKLIKLNNNYGKRKIVKKGRYRCNAKNPVYIIPRKSLLNSIGKISQYIL